MSNLRWHSTRRVTRLLLLSTFLAGTVIIPVAAAPTGGEITSGQGSITQNGNTSLIDQGSDRLIIEWDSFDTTAREQVRFLQPSSDAAVLNRILSGQATIFDGSLFANGNVIIVNGAGIHFGPTAHIDVGSLIASTAGITDRNFLDNRLIFDQPGKPDAMITNAGTITVRDAGLAALVAPGVENSGLIQANLGTVILGAGEAHTIDFAGDGLISFTITEPTKTAPKKQDGSTADALATNTGTLQADGGSVIITASQASRILDNAINMSGVAQANSVGMRNGKIVLFGGGKGRVNVGGTVRANGIGRGETGGTIHISGESIPIPKSRIEALGEAGGGTVLIGGARKGGALSDTREIGYLQAGDLVSILTGTGAGAAGNGYMPTADSVVFGEEATIDVSATGNGNGGSVVLWGNDAAYFHGTITTLGGDNGFVEVSTKGTGVIDGTALTGHMLVDPGDVCVTTAGTSGCTAVATSVASSTIVSVLNNGGLFGLNTNSVTNSGTGRVDFGGGGNIIVDNNSGTIGTFRIHAADEINTQQVGFQTNGTTGTNYEFYAGSSQSTGAVSTADVVLFGQNFQTGGGHVIFDAADDIRIGDPLVTAGGDVSLVARGGDSGSTITFDGGADGRIDTTSGGNAGAVTLQADELVVTTSANPVINANGTAGIVTLLPFTNGYTIDLGTDTAGSLGLTDAVLDLISADTLRIGSAASGNITVSDQITLANVNTLSLITGGAITDGTGGEQTDITVANLALQAASGIGASDELDVAVSNLAFANTGGAVNIANTGGLTINTADGLTASSNTGTTTTISASSPVTIAANLSGAGNLTVTAGETADAGAFADDLTVNVGVTVQSTGGNVTLQAGDELILGANATASAAGTLSLTAGFNDADSGGQLQIDSTATLAGNPVNLTSFDDFAVGVLNLPGATVNITSTNGAITDGNDPADGTLNITAQNLTLSANTGIGGTGTTATIETQVSNLEAITTSGGIFIDNATDLTIGGVSGSITGLSVTNGGDIEIGADSLAITEAVNAGTGIVTLRPLSAGIAIDLGTEAVGSLSLTDAELDLVTADILRVGSSTSGKVSVTDTISPAGTDTLSVISGADIDDDNNGIDFQVSNLALQAVTGIGNAGPRIIIDTVVDTVAAYNATSGAILIVENGPTGGDLTVGTVDGVVGIRNDASGPFAGNMSAQIETNGGDLTINNDVSVANGNLLLVAQHVGGGDQTLTNNANVSSNNGRIDIRANNMALENGTVSAGSGRVILRNELAGVAIDLGGADAAGTLGLTDAELDTVSTTGVLQIGSSTAGDITVTAQIQPANATSLELQTAGAVLDGTAGEQADLTATDITISSATGIGLAGNDLDTDATTLTFTNSTSGAVNVTNTGQVTATGASNVSSLIAEGSVFNVTTSASVTATDTIGITAPTVNLDGNLTAVNGISGTATTVNVLGSAGGAEIQDAVDVAVAGASVNVAAGSYSGFTIDKQNLTVDGVGATTIVNAASPAVTVAANGATVQDMLLQGTGAVDEVGVLLDGTAAPNLTGVSITNVDFDNLDDGIRSQGDIGDGIAANVDVAIAGASAADPALFSDFLDSAIDVGDTDGDAVYTVSNIAVFDGSDADAVSTASDAIRFGSVARAAVTESVLLDAGRDGIRFSETLTDADIDVAIAFFRTAQHGIHVVSALAGDTDFSVNDAAFGISTLRVGGDGIVFAGGITDTATVTLGGANRVFATGRAINVSDLQSSSTLSITSGLYDGTGGGLLVDNTGVAGTDGRLDVGPAAFVGGTGSTVFEVLTDTGNAGVDIDFSGRASFINGATGIRLSGPGIDVLNDTFGNISFNSQTTSYIELASGAEFLPGSPTLLDVTGVDFDGLDQSVLADQLTLEQRLVHYLDDPTLGLLNFDALVVPDSQSIQLAVNAAGILGGVQTVTVGSGTFGGSVEVWVDDLTLTGQGATSIINADTVDPFANNGNLGVGFQVAAVSATSGGGDVTGVTVENFAFTSTGLGDPGIELGASGSSTAIDTTLSNNLFSSLDIGIHSNLSGGATVITGNTMTSIADRGINFDDAVTAGEEVTIRGNDVTSSSWALVFDSAVSNATVNIAGNTLTNTDPDDDAILFDGNVNNSTVMIGGATAADANDIVGASDGIDVDDIIGGIFTIANNTRIVGQSGDGIEFDRNISGNAVVLVHNNDLIQGADNGIFFINTIMSSDIGIAYNTNIIGDSENGIIFRRDIENGARVGVLGNDLVRGGDNGVLFVSPITSSEVAVAGNGAITGTASNGIAFLDDIVDSDVTVGSYSVTFNNRTHDFGGNTITGGFTGILHSEGAAISGTSVANYTDNTITGGFDGIFFETIEDSAQVNITDNASIVGQIFEGIFFFLGVEDDAAVTIARNTITGGDDGVEFNEEITDNVTVSISDNTITGDSDGVEFEEGLRDNVEVTISGNTITGTTQNGVEVDGLFEATSLTISGNTITGGDNGVAVEEEITGTATTTISSNTISGGNGIAFNGFVDTAASDGVRIADNTRINGSAGNGVHFAGDVTGTPITISGNDDIAGTEAGVKIDSIGGSTVTTSSSKITGGAGGFTVAASTTSGSDNTFDFSNSEIVGERGPGLMITTGAGGSGATMVFDTMTFTGSPALALSGPNQAISGNTLSGSAFNGTNGGNFIELSNGALFEPGQPTLIAGNGATFDGQLVPDRAPLGLIASIESRLIDFDDDATLGQIFFIPSELGLGVELPEHVRTTNIQAPGDWILRPDYPFQILATGIFLETYGIGHCGQVDGDTDGRVACIAPVFGSDISEWVDAYLAGIGFGSQ